MRKFELMILIVVLVIFLLLFVFIPEGKEETIFNESSNLPNISNSIENRVIMEQIVTGNGSKEILNLSDPDEFVNHKLIEKSNKKFNELTNSGDD
jgi:predicted PurR-regulated permease PerM